MTGHASGTGPVDITFTITTCKRFDLFRATIDSFLSCCTDVDRIGRFICVDDDSDREDREAMARLYPFFTFYWKTPAERGHARSMNLLRSLVRSPYVLHMEDDWQFVARLDYCGWALDVLAHDPCIGQVLFNRNYAETSGDVPAAGGFSRLTPRGRPYILHEHYPTGTPELAEFVRTRRGPCHAYWPHYSLRPSLLRNRVWAELGSFDESPTGHFELAYAERYTRGGFRSAFLDGIHCLHTGRLTTEVDDPTKKNAYELNGQAQFGRLRGATVESPAATVVDGDRTLVEETDYLCARWALERRFLLSSETLEAMLPADVESLANQCVTIVRPDEDKGEPAALERFYSAPVSYRVRSRRIVLPRQWITIDRDVSIRVINLDRRPDRWRTMVKALFAAKVPRFSRVSAVDGRDLAATDEILHLFRDNDFGFRRSFIGCALSHIGLWRALAAEPSPEAAYLILEDDVVLHVDFLAQWSRRYDELMSADPQWDLWYLGFSSRVTPERDGADRRVTGFPAPPRGMIGGSFAYMLRPSGARKLLGWIAEDGVRHGIDYELMRRLPAMRAYAVIPPIVLSDYATADLPVDSDIQYDGAPVRQHPG